LKKIRVAQLVKKLPTFSGTGWFNAGLTRVCTNLEPGDSNIHL
jgi:hypothetical protein